MILHCDVCKAHVDATVVARYIHQSTPEDMEHGIDHRRSSLCKCPRCDLPMLATQLFVGENIDTDDEWTDGQRVWPPTSNILWSIPDDIRRPVREARTCLDNACFMAAGLMCRTTIEAFCVYHKAVGPNLMAKIDNLHASGVIDDRLKQWAHALRDSGNFVAHVPTERFSHEEARDAVEFTETFLEYAFVLAKRFGDYVARQKARTAKAKGKTP